MRRALVAWLVGCLAVPFPVAAAAGESDSYKVKATLLSFDPAANRLSYVDANGGATRSASLADEAVAQVMKLKSGQSITLRCRNVPSAATPVVESIEKRSHKKLVILGLVLVGVVAMSAYMVSQGPI